MTTLAERMELIAVDDRSYANARKVELRAASRCICGPLVGFVSRNGTVHGPVVRGGKCQRCIDVHAGRLKTQRRRRRGRWE